MTAKGKIDMGVMASLPYVDPFDEPENFRNPSVRRGRIVRVKYNIRTAVIQGFPESASELPIENMKKSTRPYLNKNSRPSTCNVLRRKRSNIPQKNTKQNSCCLSFLQQSLNSSKAAGMSNVYETLSSALKGKPENVFAFNSFIAKLAENGLRKSTAITSPSNNLFREKKETLLTSGKLTSFIGRSKKVEIRSKSSGQYRQRKGKRFSLLDTNRSMDKDLIIRNNHTLDGASSIRSLPTAPGSANTSLVGTSHNSRKQLFTNKFLKGKIGPDVTNLEGWKDGDDVIGKIGEEEIEESPVKERLDAKYKQRFQIMNLLIAQYYYAQRQNATYYQQQINYKVKLMNKSQHYEEVAIIVTEMLKDNSNGRLVTVPKGTIKIFEHIQNRTYRSYCYEFCGQCEIPFHKCKFLLNKKELKLDRKVLDPCEIHVRQSNGKHAGTSIQQSLVKVFATRLYSDLKLLFKGETFHVHKGILMARSPKFHTMLTSVMKEGRDSTITVLSNCTPNIFKTMLTWVYTGDCAMPENVFEVCKLLALADEYLLTDLVSVCEEDILLKVDAENVVKILTQDGIGIPEQCEHKIFTECKNVLLTEFEAIYAADPEVEKKLVSVPGLITKILLHANDSKQLSRKSIGKTAKKKVRFNLSKSEIMTHAESHSFIDTMEYERIHSASQSDTQSVYSFFNGNPEGEEVPRDEENGSPTSPRNLDLNDQQFYMLLTLRCSQCIQQRVYKLLVISGSICLLRPTLWQNQTLLSAKIRPWPLRPIICAPRWLLHPLRVVFQYDDNWFQVLCVSQPQLQLLLYHLDGICWRFPLGLEQLSRRSWSQYAQCRRLGNS
eukprot:TRINITY_DN788_c0_g1_i2.p1 TRINITY_DN788_c0_g1~~TRINITY_DN788_c0_g1_i2.p1  ORF type:complete len:832 (-),score=41.54 TRINITY_DN788_c0_g1_i2:3625-6120(-)